MTRDRIAAERRGRHAETLCVWLLRLKGYRILARRLRTPHGEIDILAKRGNQLAVIEVKARATVEAAIESVSPAQRQRLLNAAGWLPNWRPSLGEAGIRFDVMAVTPSGFPRHVPDAWQAG